MKTACRPFFSIVIPVYNRAQKLRCAIASVLSQSVNDFEIIVVDDGSDLDSPGDVVGETGDGRIKFIRKPNEGGGAARNRGVDEANGKYICFLDSDDVYITDYLARLHNLFLRSPEVVAYSQVLVERNEEISYIKPPRALRKHEDISEYLLCDRGFVQTSTLAVPALLAKKVRYDESLPYGQDTDFAIRLFAEGAEFHMLDAPGAIWDDSGSVGRVSSTSRSDARLAWLSKVRPLITKKAYYGDLGWPVAKFLFREGRVIKSLFYYFRALIYGCYSAKLSAVVFLQIILGDGPYRCFANYLAKRGIKP